METRTRYSNLYIPSDFYHLCMEWSKAFSLDTPFSLGHATKFHILPDGADPLEPFPTPIDPPDADYSYSAKVFMLGILYLIK